jgi:hypothetical protein
MFDRSLQVIVPLDKVLVIPGQALSLRFGTTTFDTTMKELKALHRGIWQSLVNGRVPSRGHEDDGVVLLW